MLFLPLGSISVSIRHISNVLVSILFAALAFEPSNILSTLAEDANIVAAITVYITTVGIANYLIFGWLDLPLLDRIADLLVHAVIPVMTLCYQLFAADKAQLQYAYLGYWFIVPIGYAIYTIAHGKWSKFYPYEFTNVEMLGIKRVLLNAVGLSIAVLMGSALFIGLGNVMV